MLYIDKYIPETFDDLTFNKSVIDKMKIISEKNNLPHLILLGGSSSGKKTIANLYINYKHQNLIRKTKILIINCKNKKKEVKIIYSNYHIQINPSIYGVYDRIIIKNYINDIIRNNSNSGKYINIIIEDAEKLTIDAQESLRRSLEKNIDNCRFIFLVNQNSNIIEPLESRCIKIRLSMPTFDETLEIMRKISLNEKLNISESVLSEIILKSNNLKESINNMQLYTKYNCIQININNTIDKIVNLLNFGTGITLPNIYHLREILNSLIVHCTNPTYIAKYIFNSIIIKFNLKNNIELYEILINALIKCIENLNDCNKYIYHLETYILCIAYNICT